MRRVVPGSRARSGSSQTGSRSTTGSATSRRNGARTRLSSLSSDAQRRARGTERTGEPHRTGRPRREPCAGSTGRHHRGPPRGRPTAEGRRRTRDSAAGRARRRGGGPSPPRWRGASGDTGARVPDRRDADAHGDRPGADDALDDTQPDAVAAPSENVLTYTLPEGMKLQRGEGDDESDLTVSTAPELVAELQRATYESRLRPRQSRWNIRSEHGEGSHCLPASERTVARRGSRPKNCRRAEQGRRTRLTRPLDGSRTRGPAKVASGHHPTVSGWHNIRRCPSLYEAVSRTRRRRHGQRGAAWKPHAQSGFAG